MSKRSKLPERPASVCDNNLVAHPRDGGECNDRSNYLRAQEPSRTPYDSRHPYARSHGRQYNGDRTCGRIGATRSKLERLGGFPFVPSPNRFALYADHDEWTTALATNEVDLACMSAAMRQRWFRDDHQLHAVLTIAPEMAWVTTTIFPIPSHRPLQPFLETPPAARIRTPPAPPRCPPPNP